MDQAILTNLCQRFPMKVMPSGLIRTMPVRLVFDKHLHTPDKTIDGKKDRWKCGFLFPEGAGDAFSRKVLVEACQALAVEEFGEKALEGVKAGKIGWPIKNQSECLTQDMEPWPGFAKDPGPKYIDVSTTIKPDTRDGTGKQLMQCELSKFYWGCWVIATISPYAADYKDPKTNATNRYIAINLHNMMFIADDERLVGGGIRTTADEDFEPLEASDSPSNAFNGAAAGTAAAEHDFG